MGLLSRTLEGRTLSVHDWGLDMGMGYPGHFNYPESLFSGRKPSEAFS